MSEIEFDDGRLLLSTDKSRLDIDLIHSFLSTQSYWVPGIYRDKVQTAIANSLCFGAYTDGRQIAFARVVTDFVGFAYLADVFVVAERRGAGISKRLLHFVFDHPRLQSMRRFMLATRDAHSLYAQFGFQPLQDSQRFMERYDADAMSR